MANKVSELAFLKKYIGRKYKYGAKWSLTDANPEGPIDCSGFTRWVYCQKYGLIIPDGSGNQFFATRAVDTREAKVGDLGFFVRNDGDRAVYHVGLVYDDDNMIEARGSPYNAVIFRPRRVWEAFKNFGGYRRKA